MNNTVQKIMDKTRLHAAVVYAWAEARRYSPPNKLPMLLFASTDHFNWPLRQLYSHASIDPFAEVTAPSIPPLPYCEITLICGYNERYSHWDAYQVIITTPTLDPEYRWIAEQG